MLCRTLVSLFTLCVLLPGQSTRFRDQVFARALVNKNIAYGSAVNRFTNQTEVLYLDLYRPSGDSWARRPAIVVVHGGGFQSGDKGGRFATICQDFAKRGFVAISINYRLKPTGKPITAQVVQDAAHDFKASVRWLRRHASSYGIDTGRIASLGSSAGAMTILDAAYVPGEGSSGNPGFSSEQQALVDLWGMLLDPKVMDKGETPLSIIHGTKDSVVPFRTATALKDRAAQVGVPYEYHPLVGAGHAPWNLYPSILPDILAFYWEHLELAQLAGLQARPGFAAPGTLWLDHFGIANDLALLYVAPKQLSLPIPGLGLLCVDPASMIQVQLLAFPATPRLPTHPFQIAVPQGLRGKTLYWQALHLSAKPELRCLSRCVTTAF
jgi:acetyl esterase/lipase